MLGSGWLNRCRETLRVAGWGGVGGGKEGWGGGGWKPCSLVGRDITGTSMRARTRRELAAATYTELRNCVKVEVDVVGSPSLINLWFLWM